MLTSKPRIIKASPKSDIAIVWIDIWNAQSSKNTKMLTNRCFIVGSHITTIYKASINLRVLQYKNCWKWGHSIFMCRIQDSKCVKCNGLHKSEHHQHFVWCCKLNFKISPLGLETKQETSYLHSFKCSNYKGDHQADSNLYSF